MAGKNKRGAPVGNSNAVKGFEATRALKKALALHSEGIRADEVDMIARFSVMVKMWEQQIHKALEGDDSAMKMICDRLEGKPAQLINVGGQEENPVKTKNEWTVRIIEPDARTTDTA